MHTLLTIVILICQQQQQQQQQQRQQRSHPQEQQPTLVTAITLAKVDTMTVHKLITVLRQYNEVSACSLIMIVQCKCYVSAACSCV
jgi:uncharacterized alpha/beta hydrolase family protein